MAKSIKGTSATRPVVAEAYQTRLIVAAIDFGTTYSGYAFSWNTDFEKDPLSIYAHNWVKGSTVAGSHKTSTSILFDRNHEFHSFGYEAEEKYNELSTEGHHWEWLFFYRFKMMLYNPQGLKRDTLLKDVKGETMTAIEVFSASIKYLKDQMIETCRRKKSLVNPDDINWVITVPAIWDDSSKQFMREAATNAEIHTDRLSLALEPEAASLYCCYLPTQKIAGLGHSDLRCFGKGEIYLILDAGGGTVDITVHEVLEDNTLRELHKANGGEWGGTSIDKAYEKLLQDIVGPDVLEIMQNRYRDDYSEMFRDFEVKKRTIRHDMTGHVVFGLPKFVRDTYKEMNQMEIQDSTTINVHLRQKLSFRQDKIRIDADLVKSLFTETCDKITHHLNGVFDEISSLNVEKILMVGGFSESPMLQHAVRSAFPRKRLIIPEEAGFAVLKGAVIFGHRPNMIASRICRYTYGIQALKQYEPALDPPEKRVVNGGYVLCKDAFSKHAEVGQEFQVGETFGSHKYVPSEKGQKELMISVYSSPRHHPVHIDERNSKKIGDMKVKLKEDSNYEPVSVQFVFGNTELGVVAKESGTGRETKATFDFLA